MNDHNDTEDHKTGFALIVKFFAHFLVDGQVWELDKIHISGLISVRRFTIAILPQKQILSSGREYNAIFTNYKVQGK